MIQTRREEDLKVETRYKILYEDAFFFAVEKPAPLPVHPVGRFKERNLLSLMKKDFGLAELRIVNRLDSETSGIVLVAKDRRAAGRLGLLFEKRRVLKEYHAVVFGIPEPGKGSITVSLGWLRRNSHNLRIPDPAGETARTDYETVWNRGDYSLLKLVPHTGRTHQIRAHLAFLGHPAAGDKIYIDPAVFERYLNEGWLEEMRPVVRAERLLLHASRLEFGHPETGRPVCFTSPLPACFDPPEFRQLPD